jgi:hypothetical protein
MTSRRDKEALVAYCGNRPDFAAAMDVPDNSVFAFWQ